MIDAELKAELDPRCDGIAELIKRVKERLETRTNGAEKSLTQRFDTVEQRLERLDTRQVSIEMQLIGINSSMEAA